MTEGLWYFLYSYYMRICVFDDLHSYSRGSTVAFGGIAVLTGLSVEAFKSFQNGTVSVSQRPWASSCTSGFSVNLTDHPQLQLPYHPPSFPVSPLLVLPQLHPCTPRPLPSPPPAPIHRASHTFSRPETREAFFSAAPYITCIATIASLNPERVVGEKPFLSTHRMNKAPC